MTSQSHHRSLWKKDLSYSPVHLLGHPTLTRPRIGDERNPFILLLVYLALNVFIFFRFCLLTIKIFLKLYKERTVSKLGRCVTAPATGPPSSD